MAHLLLHNAPRHTVFCWLSSIGRADAPLAQLVVSTALVMRRSSVRIWPPRQSLSEMEGFFVLFMFVVYILYSYSLKKFYTGFTADIDQRMMFHNLGMNHFTKKGIPWKVVKTFEISDKSIS